MDTKMKSLSDSYVFTMMNKNNVMNNTILKAILDGEEISLEKNLPEANIVINRNYKYPLKQAVIKEHKNGNIVLKFSPPHIKTKNAIPFVLYQDSKKRTKVIVFADLYTTKTSDGEYHTDIKKLYCMMEAGLIALIYSKNVRSISNNTKVISSGSYIYSNMILRALNKKYSLIDKTKISSILYLASKFYLISILGLPDNELTSNHARKKIKNINNMIIDTVDSYLKIEDYKDISTFIKALSDNDLNGFGMQDLTVRGFIESFVNMYDSTAILSTELFPYFMYNVISVLNSAYLNNQYILEDMILSSGEGASLYNAIRLYYE